MAENTENTTETNAPLAETAKDNNGFYVGYMPLPAKHKALLLWLIPALLAGGVVAAVLIASQQRDPGPGVWQVDEFADRTGTLVEFPYPMLIDDEGGVHLIVDQGKVGVAEKVKGMNGKRVTLSAAKLERSGRKMYELNPAEDAIKPGDAGAIPTLKPVFANVDLVGEVIDPKCYLGAMKPGGGRTHKPCAILCITGGIPPMYVVRAVDPEGRIEETFYLLTRADGSAMQIDDVRKFVGEASSISGRIMLLGDLKILQADPATLAFVE